MICFLSFLAIVIRILKTPKHQQTSHPIFSRHLYLYCMTSGQGSWTGVWVPLKNVESNGIITKSPAQLRVFGPSAVILAVNSTLPHCTLNSTVSAHNTSTEAVSEAQIAVPRFWCLAGEAECHPMSGLVTCLTLIWSVWEHFAVVLLCDLSGVSIESDIAGLGKTETLKGQRKWAQFRRRTRPKPFYKYLYLYLYEEQLKL